jgi:hypothetical protein
VYLDRPALPEPVRERDHVRWVFREPVRVDTPGPDARLTEIRQYRDRIEFTIWPFMDVTIKITE